VEKQVYKYKQREGKKNGKLFSVQSDRNGQLSILQEFQSLWTNKILISTSSTSTNFHKEDSGRELHVVHSAFKVN
jgi:hypothetical protein